jgi:hypothetical protein
VDIQSTAAQVVGGAPCVHHSILEDAECRFPSHLTAGPSVHPGYESQYTNNTAE